MRRSDLTGKVFGKLSVEGLSEISRNSHSRWSVVCECGVRKTVLGTHLIQGNTKSCGCDRRPPRNFKGVGLMPKSYFDSLKRGAEGYKSRRAIPFNITMQEAWDLYQAQGGRCALSGLEISFRARTASLDRIDSSVGYEADNVQWLHKDVNMMKRHYSQEYLIDLCRRIVDLTEEG